MNKCMMNVILDISTSEYLYEYVTCRRVMKHFDIGVATLIVGASVTGSGHDALCTYPD